MSTDSQSACFLRFTNVKKNVQLSTNLGVKRLITAALRLSRQKTPVHRAGYTVI